MWNSISVSVIIPVYNAENFVEAAVQSALMQEEVSEVIIVEDGSYDNSLFVCQELAKKHTEIKLLQHPGGSNKGAGASRNLGLKEATKEFISFLDADDFYLDGRFTDLNRLIERYPEGDGFHGRAKHIFTSTEVRAQFEAIYGAQEEIGFSEAVPPEKLFELFATKPRTYFRLDSVVIKRDFLKTVGGFDESLLQTQDTDFLLRCCLWGKLYFTGELEPRTYVRIHGDNRILRKEEGEQYRYLLMKKWLYLSLRAEIPSKAIRYFLRAFLDAHPSVRNYKVQMWLRLALKSIIGGKYFAKYPLSGVKLIIRML